MRARLVNLSSCSKVTACLSIASAVCFSSSVIDSHLSDNPRTRSTTRPSRDDVDRIMLPHADISTAGVIIAVKTAIAEFESIVGNSREPFLYRDKLSRGQPPGGPEIRRLRRPGKVGAAAMA